MNRFVIALMVAMMAAIPVEGQKTMEEVKAIIMSHEKDCMAETNAPEAEVAVMRAHGPPTSAAGKCMISCMYTKLGMIKDGKYSGEAMIEKAKMVLAEDDPMFAKMKRIATECENNVDGEDVCEMAAKVMECQIKLHKELDVPLLS